jgi:hypothetical protein
MQIDSTPSQRSAMQERDNLPPLPPDFGKGLLPVVDDFDWIYSARGGPLWFWDVELEMQDCGLSENPHS